MNQSRRVAICLAIDKKVVSSTPVNAHLLDRIAELLESGLYGCTTAEALARCVERHVDASHQGGEPEA